MSTRTLRSHIEWHASHRECDFSISNFPLSFLSSNREWDHVYFHFRKHTFCMRKKLSSLIFEQKIHEHYFPPKAGKVFSLTEGSSNYIIREGHVLPMTPHHSWELFRATMLLTATLLMIDPQGDSSIAWPGWDGGGWNIFSFYLNPWSSIIYFFLEEGVFVQNTNNTSHGVLTWVNIKEWSLSLKKILNIKSFIFEEVPKTIFFKIWSTQKSLFSWPLPSINRRTADLNSLFCCRIKLLMK